MASVVEYQKCWICLNPVMGCRYGCRYCILSNRGFEAFENAATPREAIRRLVDYAWFTPHESPVAINNYSDPFAGPVRESTLRALAELESRQLRNPVGIITKSKLTDRDIEFLANLHYVRPFVFISLSGLPTEVEPVPVEWRVQSLEKLSAVPVPTIHYWRPLVRGWNSDELTLQEVMEMSAPYADAAVVAGLKLSPPVETELGALKTKLPAEDWHPDCKVFAHEILDRILSIRDRCYPEYPMFRKTSCVVSYFLGQSDFNGNWVNSEEYRCDSCPNLGRCVSYSRPSEPDIQRVKERFGVLGNHTFRDGRLHVVGSLSLETRTAMRHSLRIRVTSDETQIPVYFRGENFPLAEGQAPKT